MVWGSSFILIKKGLLGFTALQLGGLRIVFAAIILLIIGFKSLKGISVRDWKWVTVAGFCSSFFPPFFFAFAQTQIDSGVTSIFNSLVPLNTALVGALLFGVLISKRQLLGVFIGLFGTIALIVIGADFNPNQNYWYAIFILLSTITYSLNINIIKKYLSHLSPMAVTAGSFGVVLIPTIIVLLFSGLTVEMFQKPLKNSALLYIVLLAFMGTAFANIFFNKLIRVSSPVFAASVTYTIPLVAIFWGVVDGEVLDVFQFIGGAIILFGVYLANKRQRQV